MADRVKVCVDAPPDVTEDEDVAEAILEELFGKVESILGVSLGCEHGSRGRSFCTDENGRDYDAYHYYNARQGKACLVLITLDGG